MTPVDLVRIKSGLKNLRPDAIKNAIIKDLFDCVAEIEFLRERINTITNDLMNRKLP